MRPLALLLALAALPASASAAHYETPRPIPGSSGVGECLAATPDGSVVAWSHRRGGARVTGPGGAVSRPGATRLCAEPASDGTALAAGAPDASNLLLSWRGADGRFGAFAPVGPTGVELAHDGGFSVGGGLAAVGFRRNADGRAFVALVRRDGGPLVGPIALPGEPGDGEAVGPLVGLDAAGRGLVIWSSGTRLLGATLSPDGAVGPVQALSPREPEAYQQTRLAVGPDGRAAAAWMTRERTTVATGDTSRGLDLATAASTRVAQAAAIQPDGAAIAADVSRVVRVTSRAAGRPFARPRRYPATVQADAPPALAISRGRAIAAFSPNPVDGPILDTLVAIAGPAGRLPTRPVPVPVASAEVVEVAAALPGGVPTILANLSRRTDSQGGIVRERSEVAAMRLRAGKAPRPPRVRVDVPAAQRLGRPQALRLRVRCPRACAIRVAGAVGTRGHFDSARKLPGGRTVTLRIPYASDAGHETPPLRGVHRVRLSIGIDDARGEARLARRVRIRT